MAKKNAKGNAADVSAREATYTVGPATVMDVFNAFLHSQGDNDLLAEEWYNLHNQEKIELERNKKAAERRAAQRRQRKQQKQKEAEDRRLWAKRNDPVNLAKCATQIQRIARGSPIRKKFLQLKRSLNDHPQKRALIIVIDSLDDKRIRPPSLVCRNGLEMAKIFQAWNFTVDVYCSMAKDEAYRPTKENVMRALEEAARTPEDNFLWVHVCGNGGTATVHGKNWRQQARRKEMLLQSPRSRLLHALQTHRRSVAGDTSSFLFPADAKSTRLTFDSVIAFEDVLDVLEKRHCNLIFEQPTNQRVVTIEVEQFGFVEGAQGGGAAVFASSHTPQFVYELPAAILGQNVVDPYRGMLSAAIIDCFRGHSWKQKEEAKIPGLYVNDIASHVDNVMKSIGIQAEKRGVGWCTFPVLCSERAPFVMMYLEKAFGSTMSPLPGKENDELALIPKQFQRRRRRPISYHRQSLLSVSLRVDITKAPTSIDVFHPDFAAVAAQYLHVLSQPDITLPQHRLQKTSFARVALPHTLSIGVNGTFVDLSARSKTKGAEFCTWTELYNELTGKQFSAEEVVSKVHCGRTEEGGIEISVDIPSDEFLRSVLSRLDRIPSHLSGLTHSSLLLSCRCEMFATVVGYEQLMAEARGARTIESELHQIVAGEFQRVSRAAADITKSLDLNLTTQMSSGEMGSGLSPMAAADPFLPPLEQCLTQSCEGLTLRHPEYIKMFLQTKKIRVVDVEQLCQRVNDLDDTVMDALARRERPLGAPVAFKHTGVVLCIVLMSGSVETKAKQMAEMQSASRWLEPFFGFRLLLWDYAEQTKVDPKDYYPKDRTVKLCDAIRGTISSSQNLPVLLMFDLLKKRYYRSRLAPPGTSFTAFHLVHFCEEYLKGSLGELLPPLKGVKVYGGGASTTKYTLIPV